MASATALKETLSQHEKTDALTITALTATGRTASAVAVPRSAPPANLDAPSATSGVSPAGKRRSCDASLARMDALPRLAASTPVIRAIDKRPLHNHPGRF